jgi:hypothetical protein
MILLSYKLLSVCLTPKVLTQHQTLVSIIISHNLLKFTDYVMHQQFRPFPANVDKMVGSCQC